MKSQSIDHPPRPSPVWSLPGSQALIYLLLRLKGSLCLLSLASLLVLNTPSSPSLQVFSWPLPGNFFPRWQSFTISLFSAPCLSVPLAMRSSWWHFRKQEPRTLEAIAFLPYIFLCIAFTNTEQRMHLFLICSSWQGRPYAAHTVFPVFRTVSSIKNGTNISQINPHHLGNCHLSSL